ncbi:putative binding-protein dependent transporter [Streptomyces sp. Tu6071]|nr:putative binding-protein dependent transporter [Streptomyces sp. Tu6071]
MDQEHPGDAEEQEDDADDLAVAEVALRERLLVDEVGERRGGGAGAALGEEQDERRRGEQRPEELEHRQRADVVLDHGEGDLPHDAEGPGAVEARGLDDLARHARQAGGEEDGGPADAAPQVDGDDGGQGGARVGEPGVGERVEAGRAQEAVGAAVRREDPVEDHAGHGDRDEPRREVEDRQDAVAAWARAQVVAQHEGERDHHGEDDGDLDGAVAQRVEEDVVAEDVADVLGAGVVGLVDEALPLQRGDDEHRDERADREDGEPHEGGDGEPEQARGVEGAAAAAGGEGGRRGAGR